MKRVLVGLLVAGLLVFGSGTAFAASDSDNITQLPYNPGNYPLGALLESLMVEGVLTAEQYNAFWGLLDYLGIDVVEAARVTITLGADGSVTIPWGIDQYIYSFSAGQFITYPDAHGAGDVKAMASQTYILRKNSDISDPSFADPTRARYLSVIAAMGGGGGGGSGSGKSGGGGCSALTLGAVILFLIPAFAVAKRGKK